MDYSTRTHRMHSFFRSLTAAVLVAAVGFTAVLPDAVQAQRAPAGREDPPAERVPEGSEDDQRDDAFGPNGNGRVTTDVGRNDRSFDMAVQGDDRLLLVGDSRNKSVGDLAVVRYNANGTLDNTCGGDGIATFDFGAREDARGVAIQGGQAVVVGTIGDQKGKVRDVLIIRINLATCTLDNTFNNNTGRQVIDLGRKDDAAEDVAIYQDGTGRIAVVGKSGKNSAVIRLNANGTRDNTFDGDGVLIVDLGKTDALNGVAIHNVGGVHRIVAAGVARKDFVIARFENNGALDASFDADGKQQIGFGGDDVATSIAIQIVDGEPRIVAAGHTDSGDNDQADFAVIRLRQDGGRDGNFGDGGEQETGFDGDDRAFDVVIQPDNKIVVAGFTAEDDGDDANFALVRYNVGGGRDTDFGNDGRVVTNFGNDDQARAVGIQTGLGRIVAAGYTDDSGDDVIDFAAVRYFINQP